ncbi:MAG: DUF1569 domain-containing protein [Caldithrix sp.]|nr:MAG: DUF1569 domain-containing protein [Caldithrix sp.]
MTLDLPTLNKLNNYIPRCSVRNEKVSKWTVGMQIEHCLLGTRGICSALVKSKPNAGKIKKGFLRRIIFLTGTIPRGRGKSPDAALPNEQTTESELRELLAEASLSAQKAAESDCDCWWKHFAFGVMKRDEALRFVEIHNKHHLKIISDILSHN